jgi:hypothetical protein
MNSLGIYLAGIGLTLVAALAVQLYLQTHLRGMLLDLCGTAERAGFWTAFSNVVLTLTPVIFALHQQPATASSVGLTFELGAQLEWALCGLVASVVVLGLVLSSVISRHGPQRSAAGERGQAA